MELRKRWGVLPTHHERKGELYYMIVSAVVKVLNKKSNKFIAKDGAERESFKATISQDEDAVIAEINIRPNVFSLIEKGKEYELSGEYMVTKNGNYISWVSAKPTIISGNKNTI